MTPRDLDRRLPVALGELAEAPYPDYVEQVLATAATRRQRPAWSFPERWFQMEISTARVPTPGMPWRQITVAGILVALLVTAVMVYAGSQPHRPEPFGPAANGSLLYVRDGDLFVRDSMDGGERPLLVGPGEDRTPLISPDGTRVAFVRSTGDGEALMVAGIDGSSLAAIDDGALRPVTAAAWAPDSRRLAIIGEVAGIPRLVIVSIDGGPATTVDIPDGSPSQVAWRPSPDDELLVRVLEPGGRVSLAIATTDGSAARRITDSLPVGSFGWGQLDAPVWSPDGQHIAYTALRSISGITVVRVRVMRHDGTGDVGLAGPDETIIQEGWPAYSPDGSTLAVHRWRWQGDGWLAAYGDLDGPARDLAPRIASNGGDVDLVKTWSPDGTRLLARTTNTAQLFEVDPRAGTARDTGWTVTELPSWQRLAP